jgi:4-aminobutyrate--pyruvate transaminase
MSKQPGFPLILGASNLRSLEHERPLVFTRGEGVFIWDEHGRKYLEAASCFYCAALGLSEPEIALAASAQMRQLTFSISAGHRTTPPTIALAERLAALAPFANAHVAFANSGSEANDALIKFVRYANVASGQPTRRKVICRSGSYHGCTTVAASLGSSKSLRLAFGLSTDDIIDVSQPDYSRAPPGESEAAFVDRLGRELEEVIERAGPGSIAAFVAEPVSFSAGFVIPPSAYFPRVTEILQRHGIRFFGDEIVTGFYRLGPRMGWEALGLQYQAFTLGKALTAAFVPMGAVVLDEDLFEGLAAGSPQGLFGHVSTYAGHPVCAAVALRVLELFEERRIADHVATVSPAFKTSLERLGSHPLVRNVRCLGLGAGVYLQVPPELPKSASAVLGSAVQAQALANGLIVRVNADVVIIAPPLIISLGEIADLVQRLHAALDGAAELLRRPEAVRWDPTVVHPNSV